MRGPGTNEQQIETMKEKMGKDSIEQAHSIVEKYDTDIIKLAYKITRTNTVKNELPKSVTRLLDNLSEEDAKSVRGMLVQAQHDPIKVNVRDGGPRHMP